MSAKHTKAYNCCHQTSRAGGPHSTVCCRLRFSCFEAVKGGPIDAQSNTSLAPGTPARTPDLVAILRAWAMPLQELSLLKLSSCNYASPCFVRLHGFCHI